MQEIKCPHCGKMFQIDESGYALIVQQVRDGEFHKELERRAKEIGEISKKDLAIAVSEKDREIEQLKSQLDGLDREKELAVSNALREKEKESESAISKKNEELSEKKGLILQLEERLKGYETEKTLAVNEAVRIKEQEIFDKTAEINDLKSQLQGKDKELELNANALKTKYDEQLKLKDEQIEYYKDFKARQSTKMVGESLEQHCLNQFNTIRMTAFPNAYFEKDNDARSGSKGDFIFRDFDEEGNEFISIMFEMKNEMDTTATKHKNEDFFKELDKDRNEKKCEYAVLVSLLESDNDFFNNGIVDVSYRYEKMYVVRPQFFIPIITLLRNAAQNSLKYRQELIKIQNRELDITNFEENLNVFKDSFFDSFRKASERYDDAIKGIDSAISTLNRIKENLTKSEKHLSAANNKVDKVNVARLTKNAPSVKALFDAQKEKK